MEYESERIEYITLRETEEIMEKDETEARNKKQKNTWASLGAIGATGILIHYTIKKTDDIGKKIKKYEKSIEHAEKMISIYEKDKESEDMFERFQASEWINDYKAAISSYKEDMQPYKTTEGILYGGVGTGITATLLFGFLALKAARKLSNIRLFNGDSKSYIRNNYHNKRIDLREG